MKPEENPKSSVMLTPVSEVSSMELVTLSPPQISPSSQLSETASDTSAPEVPDAVGSTNESGIRADTSSTNGVPGTDDDKDPKKSKAHLHCPVCKVTVNSISQLEAHNSGKSVMCDLEACTFFLENRNVLKSFFTFSTFGSVLPNYILTLQHTCQLSAVYTRYKAQTDAGGSQCSATTQGQSGGSSCRLQE